MEVENDPIVEVLGPILHFHDYGRKSKCLGKLRLWQGKYRSKGLLSQDWAENSSVF